MDPKTMRLLHWEGDLPELGHYLQTVTGSTYLTIGVKPNLRPNAKSVAKLDTLKLTSEDKKNMPPDAVVHSFYWTARK